MFSSCFGSIEEPDSSLLHGVYWPTFFLFFPLVVQICSGKVYRLCSLKVGRYYQVVYLTNVFLALDKGRSKNIGTKSFVPERPGTKVSNSLAKKCQKIVFFFSKNGFFSLRSFCSVSYPNTGHSRLSKSHPGLSRGKISKPFLSCPVLSRPIW